MSVLDRFLRDVAIDTRADEASTSVPRSRPVSSYCSTPRHGVTGAGPRGRRACANGYLFATIEPTVATPCPTIGFIAHVDTSPEMSGANVRPIVAPASGDGRDIVLPDNPSAVLRPSEWPELAAQMGHDIVTASGTTLLGGDDKAGSRARSWLRPNTWLRIRRFHTDGSGSASRRTKRSVAGRITSTSHGSAPCARTRPRRWRCWSAGDGELLSRRDGGVTSSASTRILDTPRDGWSMRSRPPRASSIGCRTTACRRKRPSDTRGSCIPIRWRRPSIVMSVRVLIRDFDTAQLAEKEALVEAIARAVGSETGTSVEIAVHPSYRNMREVLDRHPEVVERARTAIRRGGLQPDERPIRGGTDGSRLSFMGLPTPNLFAGEHNFHSRLEWTSRQDLEKAVEVIVHLARVWG